MSTGGGVGGMFAFRNPINMVAEPVRSPPTRPENVRLGAPPGLGRRERSRSEDDENNENTRGRARRARTQDPNEAARNIPVPPDSQSDKGRGKGSGFESQSPQQNVGGGGPTLEDKINMIFQMMMQNGGLPRAENTAPQMGRPPNFENASFNARGPSNFENRENQNKERIPRVVLDEKYFRRIEKFDGDVNKFRGWLFDLGSLRIH